MIPDMSNFCIYGAVLTSLITTFYLYIKYKHKYWSRKGVYTPPVHWLFGHFKNCIMQRTSSPQMLADMYNSCNESVVGIYIFQKPFLIVRSPEVLKHIFIKDFNFFPNHYFASKRKNDVLGSSNLFSVDNPKWKYLRNKMSPIFTTGKQKHLFNQILKISENFKQYIVDHLDNGKQSTINIKDGASKFTTDVISSLSFGISTNSFEKPEPEFFVRSRTPFILSFRGAIQLFANFFFPKLNDIFGFTFFGKETEYFRKIFSLSMKNREESGYKRGDVIDVMLDIKKEKNPDFEFEDDELLAQSAIILVAGLETSSVTISFALYELAMQPTFQTKIREEIKKKIGNDKLNYEHISEMKYVNQVVSETLRLYPPVPLIDRISVEDYKIPETDIVLDKETAVFASVIGLHTDPKYFTNPFKYDPDRFSDERISDMTPGTYIPFGIGPRTCIGNIVYNNVSNAKTLMGHNIRRPSSIEFPFIAGIIRRNRDFITERDTVCTASLITDKNILTAEHCLTNEVVNGLIIIVGSNDLQSPSRYYPAWWISFNQWSKLPSSRTTIYSNDIAVINLSTIIRDRIPYGILSFLSYRELRNKDVVTVGWGEINNGSFPRLLHAVNLKVLTKTDCALRARALSGENFKINENLICTVGDPFALLMRGDSGGPLLYKNKIVGINTGTGPLPQQSFHPDKINLHCNLKHYNDFLLNIISYM